MQVSDIEEVTKVQQAQQNAHDHGAIPKTLGWKGAFFNQVAYAIALGILSIPLVAVSLGVVPFVLLTFLFAYICWYTGDQYWKLKMRFPGVQNLQDAGFLMFGPWGARFLGAAQLIFSSSCRATTCCSAHRRSTCSAGTRAPSRSPPSLPSSRSSSRCRARTSSSPSRPLSRSAPSSSSSSLP